MPAPIPWEEEELQALVSSPESRVFLDQKRLPVVLQPFHLQDLKSAVRDLLNASIDCYDKSLDGILLSYKRLKVLSKSACVAAETSGVVLEIQADFYVFRPDIGSILKGVVNKISKDHVGVLLYHRFNVTCPRPDKEAKSKKWIGNNVIMRQEVVFKLKDKNFCGKLPFFMGKIMDIGTVITESEKEGDKKSSKKKNKDGKLETTAMSEVAETSTAVSKKRKLNLEESNQNMEVKMKKSKKDDTSFNEVKKHEDAGSVQVTSELSASKKKKKKVSIGSVDETDFIPRFSLDVSQLPEDLPPPNADSTHFDLTKNLSGVSLKGEKKKKLKTIDLGSIREESSEGMRELSKISEKNEHISGAKTKKELQAYISHDSKNTHEIGSSLKSLPESPKKKKQKLIESEKEQDANLKAKKAALVNSNPVESSFSVSPKKKHKLQESVEETVHKKGKKEVASFQLDHDQEKIEDHKRANTVNNKVDSKSKKKLKQDLSNIVPSPHQKTKKEKGVASGSKSDVASDDTIPPGQKSVWESPKKRQLLGSPLREQSLASVSFAKSPGIGYFAASSSMMDPDFSSSRKGARPAPLMYGNLQGKISPPPESPMKSPPGMKARGHDNDSGSDSDAPVCKKVIVSTSVHQESSDSDSETSQKKSQLMKKTNLVSKQSQDNFDDSDSDAPVKSFLQSMGVMKSPLKTSKQNLRHDSSESESEGSSEEDKNIVSDRLKAPLAVKFSNENASNHKSAKPILAAKAETSERVSSPKKPAKSNTDKKTTAKSAKLSPSKGKGSSHLSARPEESDSDSDLEAMKAAMLKMEEARLASGITKQTQKSKAKQVKPNAESDNVLSKKAKAVPEKKHEAPHITTKTTFHDPKSSDEESDSVDNKINSKSGYLSPSKGKSAANLIARGKESDSDSDSEAMKAALLKTEENQLKNVSLKQNSLSRSKLLKLNSRSDNVLSKKIQAVSEKKISCLVDSDSDSEAMKAALLKVEEKKLTSGASKQKPKSKAQQMKSNSECGKSNSELKKTNLKNANLSPSKGKSVSHSVVRPGGSDSDSEAMKAALMKMEEKRLTAPKQNTKSKGKRVKSNSESDNSTSKKTKAVSEVKPLAKLNEKGPHKPLVITSKNPITAQGVGAAASDDDSDSELMKAAMSKIREGQLLGGTSKPRAESKSKRGKSKADVLSGKTSTASNKKASDKISNNSTTVGSKDLQNLGRTLNDSENASATGITSRINEDLTSGKTSKPKSKSQSKKGKSPLENQNVSARKNLSSFSNDSDSGPDDRNTTAKMEEMRRKQIKTGKEGTKSQKVSDSVASEKSMLAAGGGEGSESINGSKSRKKKSGSKNLSSDEQKVEEKDLKKISVQTKRIKGSKGSITTEQNSVNEKKATKGKKKASADEEISDVMQRLLRQAQASVGLA